MEPNPGPGPGPGTMDPLLEEDLFTPSHDDQLSFSLEDVVDPGSTTFGSFDGDSIPQEQQQEWQQQYTNFMADALQDAGPATASASVSPVPVASQSPEPGVPLTAIDEFFLRAGAFRPPNPCAYCTRRRLQCLILQTTTANPNPTKSCSSCVALFRECSLAGRAKRQPSTFESPMPVVGGLHSVNEDNLDAQQQQQQASSSSFVPEKRTATRSVHKTRALKLWFFNHIDNPYPTEEEKTALADESGLSRAQVANWFANCRRRHRASTSRPSSSSSSSSRRRRQQTTRDGVALVGSPWPEHLSVMSPLERWKGSPPEDEGASVGDIHKALSSAHGSSAASSLDGESHGAASDDSQWQSGYTDGSSQSASSCYSAQSTGSSPLNRRLSSRGRRRAHKTKGGSYQCTFCRQAFPKRYDWLRHERSVHMPGLDSWVCGVPLPSQQSHLVWQLGEDSPRCVFCGHESPGAEHMASHELEACADRPLTERRFARKDHLWQHLAKFHGCRKWSGWQPDLGLLRHRRSAVLSRCGFCGETLQTWDERAEHLAEHFKTGATMDDWTGESPGILA